MKGKGPNTEDGNGRRRKRGVRTALFVLLGICCATGILVLLLPSFLSSGPGTSFIEKIVSSRIAGAVSFESLSLSWRRAQEVRGLVIRDADGVDVLSIESMVNDRSLWRLLSEGRDDLGTTTVMGMKGDIFADDSGDTNLMKALRVPGPAEKRKTGFVPVLPFGSLVLGESRIIVAAPGIEPVVFDFRGLNVDLPAPDKPLYIDLDLETSQGDLSGQLKVRGLAEELVDSKRRLQPLAAKVDFEASATNLPVQGIDSAFGFGGLLSGALGRKADLNVKTKAELTKADLDFSFNAPNLTAHFTSVFEDGNVRLSEEGKIAFTVTPDFIERLVRARSPGSTLRLAEEAPVIVSLQEMKFPVMPNLAQSSLMARLKASRPMRFTGLADGSDLTLRTLDMSIDALAPAEKVTVDMASDLRLGDDPGSARISAILSDIIDGSGAITRDRMKIKLDGKLQNVPTSLFEGLAGPEGAVKELFGSALNAHFSAGNPEKGKTAVELFVESDRFEADTAFVVGETIELARPARVQAKLTPRLFELAGGGGTALGGASDVSLAITRLSIPLPENDEDLPLEKVGFAAVMTVGPTVLSVGEKATFRLEGTRADVKAEGLARVSYSLASRISSTHDTVASVLGKNPLAVKATGKTGLGEEGRIVGLTADIVAANDVLSVSTAFAVAPEFLEVKMTSPLEMKWSAAAGQLEEFLPPSPGAYVPQGELQVTARVEPTKIPLKNFSPTALKTTASAQLPRLEVARDGQAEAVIEDLGIKVDFDGSKGRLAGSARAMAAFPGEEGSYPVEAELLLENVVRAGAINIPESDLTLDVESRGLPTALAGIFIDGVGWISDLAGKQADVKAAVRKSPLRAGTGEASIRLKSERLQTSAKISLGEQLSLREPLSLKLTLTPESFAALKGGKTAETEGGFVLAKPAAVTGTVSEFRLPASDGKGIGGLAFKAVLASGELVLKQKSSGRDVGLKGLTVTASSQPLSSGVTLAVRGDMTDSAGGAGLLETDLNVTNLVGRDGTIDPAGVTLKLDARAGTVPVALVDGLLGLGGLGESALGQNLDLAAKADLKGGNGSLSFKATASNARLDIDGAVNEGVFTLNKPVVGEIDVTEELGRKLLNKIHPIFNTVKTSEEPLRLEIDSRGVVVPIRNFDITGVSVPRMTVGSNRMIFRKGGTLEMIVLLARQFGGVKGLGSTGEMEVWFTPLVGEMKNGTFRYSRRLDFLIDGRLHALSWGSVSLAGGSSYDLKIGLPAESLKKILGTKRISEGDIFTLPLRGREGKVDTKGILTRGSLDLGRVRGQHELTKKDPLLGLVAGELTKKVIGTETGPVPPPSVTPLPWAGLVKPEPDPPASPDRNVKPSTTEPDSKEKSPAKPKPEEVIRDVLDLFK